MKTSLFIIIACAFVSIGMADETLLPSLNSLVETELQFAQTAMDQGVKTAFLEFLADDSVLFRPRAVSGKKWMEGRPASRDLLIWRPAYAEVSAAGDLGFTTGPWEFSRATGGDPIGYGQFLSIWKKQKDGSWKVALDTGTEHLRPEVSVFEIQLSTRSSSTTADPSSRGSLEKLDRSLSDAWERNGEMALENFIGEETLILRSDRFPGRGLQALKERIDSNARTWKFKTEKVFVADSEDLGYTYGTFERESTERSFEGTFVRIWRWEQDWRVAVDLILPDPPQ